MHVDQPLWFNQYSNMIINEITIYMNTVFSNIINNKLIMYTNTLILCILINYSFIDYKKIELSSNMKEMQISKFLWHNVNYLNHMKTNYMTQSEKILTAHYDNSEVISKIQFLRKWDVVPSQLRSICETYTRKWSDITGIDSSAVLKMWMAICYVESGIEAYKKNPAGAYGLNQIVNSTGDDLIKQGLGIDSPQYKYHHLLRKLWVKNSTFDSNGVWTSYKNDTGLLAQERMWEFRTILNSSIMNALLSNYTIELQRFKSQGYTFKAPLRNRQMALLIRTAKMDENEKVPRMLICLYAINEWGIAVYNKDNAGLLNLDAKWNRNLAVRNIYSTMLKAFNVLTDNKYQK